MLFSSEVQIFFPALQTPFFKASSLDRLELVFNLAVADLPVLTWPIPTHISPAHFCHGFKMSILMAISQCVPYICPMLPGFHRSQWL